MKENVDSATNKPSPKKDVRIGPIKNWSKVVILKSKRKNLKRKDILSNDSKNDVNDDVEDIMEKGKKKTTSKRILAEIPEVPLDNVSFHLAKK